jgi:hypothetical protein
MYSHHKINTMVSCRSLMVVWVGEWEVGGTHT